MSPRNRTANPADAVKYLTDQINDRRMRAEECFRDIAALADQLRQVAEDTTQRLLTRD